MSNIYPIDYTGPSTVYKPDIADNNAAPKSDGPATYYREGYHDIDYLNQLLDELIKSAGDIYVQCENDLANYSLIIDQSDTDLVSAHKTVYPSTDVPGYVTFQEYKYLLKNSSSNAAQYVMNAYEMNIRGTSGTNAFDIATVMLTINNEAKRIKEFINGYIGAVDDTSEFRIIENFQNWGEDTKRLVDGFRSAFQGQFSAQIPQSEVDSVPGDSAAQLQAVLQVKLNVAAKNIKDITNQLLKNWENVAPDFYAKHLGPALQFQLKVGKNLTTTFDGVKYPTLSTVVNGGLDGMRSNFAVALADQVKRNGIYSNYLEEILTNIVARDTAAYQINQFADKGKYPKQIFTHDGLVTQSDTLFQVDHPLNDYQTTVSYDDNFTPSHSDLADVDSDDAHPQYLLREGGEDSAVTGNIVLDDGATIDGMIPRLHKHTGFDGTERLPVSSIDFSAFTDADIDTTTSTTSIPANLAIFGDSSIIGPTGDTTITLQVSFDMDIIDNVSGYEFEIVELS